MNAEFVERIELKIAYLERANNDLSEVVYRQQQQIDALRAELAALNGKMEAAVSRSRRCTQPSRNDRLTIDNRQDVPTVSGTGEWYPHGFCDSSGVGGSPDATIEQGEFEVTPSAN